MEPRFNNEITAAELEDKILKGLAPILIDVREPIEFHTFNIGGLNIPLGSLEERLNEIELYKLKEIIVICKIGIRSDTAQRLLINAGFKNSRNLKGGLIAYKRLSH